MKQWKEVMSITKNSAFFRIFKRIGEITDTENWHKQMAWSNLYKASFEEGNPNAQLKNEQYEYCVKILKAEIEYLSPRFVIFLTSGWETCFIKELNGGTMPQEKNNIKWENNEYRTVSYIIDDVVYIASHHPQGKKEDPHLKAIKTIIDKNS